MQLPSELLVIPDSVTIPLMILIKQIPVLRDNYIYLLHFSDSNHTIAVDPAESQSVLATLSETGWKLTHIFNTHHHADHIGGNLELKRLTGCTIVGSAADSPRIPELDQAVMDGESVHIGGTEIRVLDVSGHTKGHVAYWIPEANAVFVGDTVFSLGCGRLFEGTPAMMWESLEKIRALPSQTRIYCAHEYTEANARFAVSVEPENQDLLKRMEQVKDMRSHGLPTVPSILAEELACNPFLRPESPVIRERLGLMDAPNVAVFAELRRRKDAF